MGAARPRSRQGTFQSICRISVESELAVPEAYLVPGLNDENHFNRHHSGHFDTPARGKFVGEERSACSRFSTVRVSPAWETDKVPGSPHALPTVEEPQCKHVVDLQIF